jgi:hypothetical protein
MQYHLGCGVFMCSCGFAVEVATFVLSTALNRISVKYNCRGECADLTTWMVLEYP